MYISQLLTNLFLLLPGSIRYNHYNQFSCINHLRQRLASYGGNNENVYCVEPELTDRNTPCVLFFTGGSAAMTPKIYENLLMRVVQNNIVVCAPPFRYERVGSLIDKLSEKYREVIIGGHSSGCTVALNNCHHPKVRKLVMMDPVNTRISNLTERYNITNIDSLLFINAMKSYNVTQDPFGLPFIPFLRITGDSLITRDTCNTTHIDFHEHGHCDVLNPFYANFMHFTRIAVGNRMRSHEMFKKYHESIAEALGNFIKRNGSGLVRNRA